MAPNQSSQLPPPEHGKIRLIIYRPANGSDYLFLEIPTHVPGSLCVHPRKYLRYLGWCILGVEGGVAMDSPFSEDAIGDEGPLEDQGVYRYNTTDDPEDNPLQRAIDPEVIKTRSSTTLGQSSYSGTSTTGQQFRAELVERDVGCVMTGDTQCDGIHIIPYACQDVWFGLIVSSRSPYDEDVSDLNSVNDIRNGMLVDSAIHRRLDSCQFAFLKTPNPVLDIGDVPNNNNPTRYLRVGTQCPADERFTLQLLVDVSNQERTQLERTRMIGQDAAFKSGTNLPKPSDLLLHYRYGAAAVKLWGHHGHLLSSSHRKNIPRPPAPVAPYPCDPSSSNDHRRTATRKRERHADNADGSKKQRGRLETRETTTRYYEEQDQGNSNPGRVIVEAVDGSTGWDEDDWMLFFLANSKAAHERRRVDGEEFSSRIRTWASGVSAGQAGQGP